MYQLEVFVVRRSGGDARVDVDSAGLAARTEQAGVRDRSVEAVVERRSGGGEHPESIAQGA